MDATYFLSQVQCAFEVTIKNQGMAHLSGGDLFLKEEYEPGSGEQDASQYLFEASCTGAGETQNTLYMPQAEFPTINGDVLAEAMKEIY